MTSYVIPTPTIKHVLKAYEYMKRKNLKGLEDSYLQRYVTRNMVADLVNISAIYIFNDNYDGYGSSAPNLSRYDHVIHMEETITL